MIINDRDYDDYSVIERNKDKRHRPKTHKGKFKEFTSKPKGFKGNRHINQKW